jgi:hypothetical protein
MTLEGFPNAVAEAQALDDALSSNGMKVSTVIYIDVVENQWLEKADPVLQEAENSATEEASTDSFGKCLLSKQGLAKLAKRLLSRPQPSKPAKTKSLTAKVLVYD